MQRYFRTALVTNVPPEQRTHRGLAALGNVLLTSVASSLKEFHKHHNNFLILKTRLPRVTFSCYIHSEKGLYNTAKKVPNSPKVACKVILSSTVSFVCMVGT